MTQSGLLKKLCQKYLKMPSDLFYLMNIMYFMAHFSSESPDKINNNLFKCLLIWIGPDFHQSIRVPQHH